MVLIVADDETALSSQLTDFTQGELEEAGVVAITGPRGYGTTRILTELQNAWLLGFGDVIIISPVGVHVGNVIHSERVENRWIVSGPFEVTIAAS